MTHLTIKEPNLKIFYKTKNCVEKKNSMRVRSEHWQVLLDMCEQNPQVITNRFNGCEGKTKGQILWQTVACKLNSLGYGEKSVNEWRKTFIDWKSKTKMKASKIRLEMQQTGGGPKSFVPLSELEERLLTLMGNKAVEGDRLSELGFGKVIVMPDASSEIHVETDATEGKSNRMDNEENQKENRITTSLKLKRKRSETSRKRLRPVQGELLSKELIDMNNESLKILEDICKNTDSISNSLNIIATVLQSRE